jgi:hypothetical protein
MMTVAGMALAALATTGNAGTLFATFASADLLFLFVVFLLRLAMVRSSSSTVLYGRSVPARLAAFAQRK